MPCSHPVSLRQERLSYRFIPRSVCSRVRQSSSSSTPLASHRLVPAQLCLCRRSSRVCPRPCLLHAVYSPLLCYPSHLERAHSSPTGTALSFSHSTRCSHPRAFAPGSRSMRGNRCPLTGHIPDIKKIESKLDKLPPHHPIASSLHTRQE